MVKKKNGFTLVELLAVIVILAIILVIAVPQIMKTIDEAKEGALISSAKLIAASAEREYLVRETLGDTNFTALTEMDCADVVDLMEDYESCTIKFNNGKASVSLKGIGKFEGKYVCFGTREEALVTSEECDITSCDVGKKMVENVYVEKPYKVKNINSCVSYINSVIEGTSYETNYGIYVEPLCNGEEFDLGGIEKLTFNTATHQIIENNVTTEKALIQNNVIKASPKKTCDNLDEEEVNYCQNDMLLKEIVYVKRPYEVKNVETCISFISGELEGTPYKTAYGNYVEPLCRGQMNGFSDALQFILTNGVTTEEELVKNDVLKIEIERVCIN